MHETSGVLRPVVIAYLEGEPLTPRQVDTMRAYLRQWIASPAWQGPGIQELRDAIGGLTSRKAIEEWLDRADDVAIDPL
jgi:hypothetical protein